MVKVSNNEMRAVEGGARYEQTCPYCKKYSVGTTYWGWLGKQVAIVVVNSKLRSHMYSCILKH